MRLKKSVPYSFLFLYLIVLLSRVDWRKENLSTLTATSPGYLSVFFLGISTGMVCAKAVARYHKRGKAVFAGALLSVIFPYRDPFKNLHIFSGYLGFVLFGTATLLVLEEHCLASPEEKYLKEMTYGFFFLLGILWAGSLVINGLIEFLFLTYIFFLYRKVEKS